MATVKALLFDVFGTLVDWYGSIQERAESIAAREGLALDGARLALLWRQRYAPSMANVTSGKRPWCDLDQLHRESLDHVLTELAVDLPSPARAELVAGWHELRPWPDVVANLPRLRAQRITAALSNGHVRLLVDLKRHAGLDFDTILSAELARSYKPEAVVYQTATRLLGLEPDQVMLVACHAWDLAGAAHAGLRTAYVARPAEWGPGTVAAPVSADMHARDLGDLADQFDALDRSARSTASG
ncbi:haloacid dehalogenase type II [Pendulispora rubella]|uniref:Haloacid dehalogenase type II n=1 Tax=Pendulispora rubella TaxID=2741070 RepID=A0ABZ2L637_9BACT